MVTHVQYEIDRRNKYTMRSRNNKENTAADERKATAQKISKIHQHVPAQRTTIFRRAQRTSSKIALVTKKKCTRNAAPNS
jgi:hypothetical protein